MEGNSSKHNKLSEIKLDAKQAQGYITFFKTLPPGRMPGLFASSIVDEVVDLGEHSTTLGHERQVQRNYRGLHQPSSNDSCWLSNIMNLDARERQVKNS